MALASLLVDMEHPDELKFVLIKCPIQTHDDNMPNLDVIETKRIIVKTKKVTPHRGQGDSSRVEGGWAWLDEQVDVA